MSNNIVKLPPPFTRKDNEWLLHKNAIANLFHAATIYVHNKIENDKDRQYFLKLSGSILNLIVNCTSFQRIKTEMKVLRQQNKNKRDLTTSYFNFFSKRELVEEEAFDIVFDIIAKTELRFVTGYA